MERKGKKRGIEIGRKNEGRGRDESRGEEMGRKGDVERMHDSAPCA